MGIRKQISKLFKKEPQSYRIHDYTKRYWGHDYTFDPRNGGYTAHMTIFGHNLNKGDLLLLASGNDRHCYKISNIKGFDDPSDMYSLSVEFVPGSTINQSKLTYVG